MDASLFAVGGVLNQLQRDREVVIAYASHSLRLAAVFTGYAIYAPHRSSFTPVAAEVSQQ